MTRAGIVLAAAAVAALCTAACSRAATRADLRPAAGQNVLLVTIDTLRADALSGYGGQASTPALDRLATEGVRFDFAHAHAVLTLPSHASILTGQYPFAHGVRDNSGYRLKPGSRTLATILKSAGYRTAAFVGAFPVHSRFGLNQGFDVYDDRFGEAHAPAEFNMPERPAVEVVALARAWIAANGSQPWLVWVHVFEPHAPYRPPPPFDAQYATRPYFGEVAAVDAALAPLFDDVRRAGRPTLAVVTGDHGESLGEHGEETHGLFAYEATLRVPLIVAELPSANRSSGDIARAPARHVDIVPTILEATGQQVPSDLAGRSLLTASERREGAASSSYFEAMSGVLNRGWAPLAGVFAGREKWIDLPLPERYDLDRDPAEQTNLGGQTPDRDRALQAALALFHAPAPGERIAENADAAARLRALGYVSGHAPAKATYTEADDPKRLVELDRMVHRAVDAFTAGRWSEAEDLYRQVIARRPDMAIAYRHLAFVEARHGRIDEAIDVLRRATAAGVTDTRIRTELGGYLADAGRLPDALRLLEPVGADASAEPDALNTLGIVYARLGRAERAQAVFERVVAVDPESSIPLENLGMLAIEHGRTEDAANWFARAVKAAPRSSRAHAGIALVASKRGDTATAIAEWKRAVDFDGTNFDALFNLAMTLSREGRRDEARPYAEAFVRTAPPPAYGAEIRQAERLLKP